MERSSLARFTRRALSVLCLLVAPLGTQAAAPTWPALLHYQGHLTDNTDADLADGNYSLEFNLYAAASGGSALWTETQSVAVKKGLFNAVLGSVTPLSGLSASVLNADLWLGVKVAADPEMTPRHQLLPGVYARNAQMLAGLLPNNAANNLLVLDGSGRVPSGVGVLGSSLVLPLDLTGSSATYALNVSNTSSAGSALGLSVAAPNGVQAQATDGSGYGVYGQTAPVDTAAAAGLRGSATNGTGVLAQSTNAVALSASSQSTNRASVLALGAFPIRLTVSSAVANNAGIQAFTQDASTYAAVADRGNKAGFFVQSTGSGIGGVSATASAGMAVYGISSSTNATDAGVVGRYIGAGQGQGVRGSASNASPGSYGVFGTVSGTGSVAVFGNFGGSDGYGVVGFHNNAAPAATSAAIYGKTSSLNLGTGVRGEGGQGVYGLSSSVCGVCAYNTGAGYALQANSNGTAIQADSTNTTGLSYGINATSLSTTNGSAAGSFSAQGDSGSTYAVYANNDSSAGYAVYANGGFEGLHVKANGGGKNIFSDPSNQPLYGFYHSDTAPPVNGVGVYAVENCESCYAGQFINTNTTTGAGAALYVQGRIKFQPNTGAGTFTAPNGATSFTLNTNPYVKSNSLIFLTVASATNSVAAVTSVVDGAFTVTFSPALSALTTYQYLIVGQ